MKKKQQNLFSRNKTDVRFALIAVLACTLVLGAAVLAWGHIQEASADSENGSIIKNIETAVTTQSAKERVTAGLYGNNQSSSNNDRASVKVEFDGKNLSVNFDEGSTVQDILKRANITLSEDDIVSPDLSEKVSAGDIIMVIRVTTETISEDVSQPYETVYEEDASIPEGETTLKQEGLNKVEKEHYLVTYHNGDEVSKELVDTELIAEGQDEIILVGTATASEESDTNEDSEDGNDTSSEGSDNTDYNEESSSDYEAENTTSTSGNNGDFSYSNVITCTAYAYVAGGYGASGNPAVVGTCAVDPSVIPLGTRLYIEGYGYAIANDTGGNIVGNTLDLVMDTTAECYQWGVRTVNVYILD